MNALKYCVVALVVVSSGCASHERVTSEERLKTMEMVQNNQAATLKQLLARTQAPMGTVHVDLVPETAVLIINGGEVRPEDGKVLLPMGTYQFRARWSDGRQVIRDIFVPAGESRVLLNAQEQASAAALR